MNYQEFCDRVLKEIRLMNEDGYLDASGVELQAVEKNNGTVLQALLISEKDRNITPSIYLEPYYEHYQDGESVMDIVYDIMDTYVKCRPSESINVEFLKDWEQVKGRLTCKLVNYEMNEKMLETVPHKRVEDLAVVYMISWNDYMGGSAVSVINNSIFDLYHISLDDLDQAARENAGVNSPYTVESMEKVLSGIVDIPFLPQNVPDMYIVSNKDGMYGAAGILNDKVQDKLREYIGEKCYVIPSSVHEMIVLPYDGYEYAQLNEMISEVNQSQLTPDEVLSEYSYVLDTKRHLLVRADQEKERLKDKVEEEKKEELLKEKEVEQKKVKPMAPKL